MFLKYKTKKAARKIANGASAKEVGNAVNEVVKEASRQVSRKFRKFEMPFKLKVVR